MQQHFQEIRKFVLEDKGSDTFAKHFASHILPPTPNEKGKRTLTAGQIRPLLKVKVLWQGNAISLMKSFQTHRCVLCMKERLEILRRSEKHSPLINSRTEIYGACRHKAKFHRYRIPTTVSADDDGRPTERIESPTIHKETVNRMAYCTPCNVRIPNQNSYFTAKV